MYYTDGVESAHHPFTAPHPDEEHLVYTNPEQVFYTIYIQFDPELFSYMTLCMFHFLKEVPFSKFFEFLTEYHGSVTGHFGISPDI